MWIVLQQIVNGLVLGSIYGLIAIGYTMVYGIIRMINFAHGEIYMIGAYIAAIVIAVVSSFTSLPGYLMVLVAILITMPVAGLHGLALERIAYRPLRNAPKLAPLITAIGMSLVLQNYVAISQGAKVQGLKPIFKESITLWRDTVNMHSVTITYNQIIILVVTLLAMTILAYVIKNTEVGRRCRCTQQDREMSEMLGVNTNNIISAVFVIGASLAGLGGFLVTMSYSSFDFFMGFVTGIKAFTAAVLGGIGSVPGAMLGGLLLGMAESYFSGFVNADYKDVFAFALLIFFMIFRPNGILGEPEVTKV